jgi:transcriptional regulator of aroF, aroG, tyrA and aromatic amino acid transport
MTLVRWTLHAEDRVGMVREILEVMAGHEANIVSMDVTPGMVHVCFHEPPNGRNAILRDLEANPDVHGVRETDALPHEKRERQLQAILDSISDGVLAIDAGGVVSTLNPSAERILGIMSREVLGRRIQDFLGEDIPMLRTLSTGESYDNLEMVLLTPKGRSHYLTTGRPIQDENGNTLGVVASLKDMGEVRSLVRRIAASVTTTFDDILHVSESMALVVDLARTVAQGDATVLIRGESGTGKELFGRAIHTASRRRSGPFVPINCAALPDSLLESELFGYEEGAFTGARRGGKPGLMELADGGTVFLDEVAELPQALQAKLLRVLQEGRIRRVGGAGEVPVDVRVIATTNRPLEDLVRTGKFREDLFYRLNVIPLFIPPLRVRPEDLLPLAEHFSATMRVLLGKPKVRFSEEAWARIRRYHWPGNVRELKNVIERAVNLAPAEIIRPEHLLLDAPEGLPEPRGQGLRQAVDDVESRILERCLSECGSSRKAARVLGVSHTTVLKKAHRHGLSHLTGGSRR